MKLTGKAHVYNRNDIDTDLIIPARYLNTDKEKELAQHAMEGLDKNFVKKAKEGDFIVSKKNFGCGSSREHAIWALRGAGIKAVIADSFARIFFRNAINNGFYAIECKGASKEIKDGDEIEIDIEKGTIKLWDSKNPKGLGNSKNHPKSKILECAQKSKAFPTFQRDIKNKKEFKFTPFPKFAIDIIKAGGLLNYIKK